MGSRLSVWIPDDQRWLVDALDKLCRRMEARGVPCSLGEVCREVLRSGLARFRADATSGTPTRADTGRGTPKRSVYFRADDIPFLETLERIVDTKREAGFATSLSFELLRLAKAGYVGGLAPGADMDRAILGGSDDSDA